MTKKVQKVCTNYHYVLTYVTKYAIKKPSIFYCFDRKGGENMKAICLIALVCCCCFVGGCGQVPLVVGDGTEYTMVSFGSTTTETESGELVPTYLITFTYADEGDTGLTETKTRGTVAVPRSVLEIDKSLSPNGIVWDAPYVIEGLTYRRVRWNPLKIEPANTDEIIKEEEPLKKK